MSAIQRKVENLEKIIEQQNEAIRLLRLDNVERTQSLIEVMIVARDCASILNLLLSKSGCTHAEITAALQAGIVKGPPTVGLRPEDTGAIVGDSGDSNTDLPSVESDRGTEEVAIVHADAGGEAGTNGDFTAGSVLAEH